MPIMPLKNRPAGAFFMKSTLIDYPNRFRSLQKEKEVIYLFISFSDFMSFCLQTLIK